MKNPLPEAARIPESLLLDLASSEYGLTPAAIRYLPLGADIDSAAYALHTSGGGRYFLKVRALAGFRPASLLVPRFLTDSGIPHVLVPLATQSGMYWIELERGVLSLFPFVQGRLAADAGMSGANWTALGRMLAQVHASRPPDELLELLPRERFIPSRRELLPQIESALRDSGQSDPLKRELAAFWDSHRTTIQRLTARADALGRQLRRREPPLVLSHGDLHAWNLLLDEQDRLWVLDWDEVALAPKERDLMFLLVGIARGLVEERETERFLEGYGGAKIDRLALAYYRFAWAVQDLAAFGEQACLRPDLSADARRDALEYLAGLFAPGKIVEIAFSSDPIACA
jgi:spectinomycin phosphotransferase